VDLWNGVKGKNGMVGEKLNMKESVGFG